MGSRQRWVFSRTNHISQQILPEDSHRRTTTRLLVDPASGLVVRQEDAWALHNRPTVRLPLAWRRLNCVCSNAVHRWLGWERELREAEARVKWA